TNRICDDLFDLLAPRRVTVKGDFAVRGGIGTVVTVTREKN
ncbi:MAG: NADPH-dependent 7-cyano-7-deazaguanine reductase QueF, partial [Myxococcaceae bacterium]|nr:NADPH-dependent 7-cyano-7-deazaguanine reductase QueF [Myxococcaceae bacterium]